MSGSTGSLSFQILLPFISVLLTHRLVSTLSLLVCTRTLWLLQPLIHTLWSSLPTPIIARRQWVLCIALFPWLVEKVHRRSAAVKLGKWYCLISYCSCVCRPAHCCQGHAYYPVYIEIIASNNCTVFCVSTSGSFLTTQWTYTVTSIFIPPLL